MRNKQFWKWEEQNRIIIFIIISSFVFPFTRSSEVFIMWTCMYMYSYLLYLFLRPFDGEIVHF
jgi:hypothetical protein